jgi:NTP pyrophosphatase (non-canonical NTP hydrolase)
MKKLQKQVAEFVSEHRLEADVPHRLLDAVSELGEISKEFLSATNYGSKEFSPTTNWENELGDLLFSIVCIANSTKVNLQHALEGALKKYKERIESGGSAESYTQQNTVPCSRSRNMQNAH